MNILMMDYVIEGTKGVITTFNTKTGEVYLAQNIYLFNYEINVDKLVKIDSINELSTGIEKLLLNYIIWNLSNTFCNKGLIASKAFSFLVTIQI